MILARNAGGEGSIPADKTIWTCSCAARAASRTWRSAIDGTLRGVAWERLDDRGLIVVVGLDQQARLDRLKPEAERIRELMGLIVVLTCLAGSGTLAVWFWRRRVAADAARTAIIRESESLFRQMAENLPDVIRLLDRRGTVLYVNPAVKELLGVAPEVLIGHHTTDSSIRMIQRAGPGWACCESRGCGPDVARSACAVPTAGSSGCNRRSTSSAMTARRRAPPGSSFRRAT